jgi:hypothetical protein
MGRRPGPAAAAPAPAAAAAKRGQALLNAAGVLKQVSYQPESAVEKCGGEWRGAGRAAYRGGGGGDKMRRYFSKKWRSVCEGTGPRTFRMA